MRYREIIEAANASEAVWNATKKKHEALRVLRSRERAAAAAVVKAKDAPTARSRSASLQSAKDRQPDARRAYQDKITAANDSIRRAQKAR